MTDAEVELREMSDEDFEIYRQLSFRNFVRESARAARKSEELILKALGQAPTTRSANDLWFIAHSADGPQGFMWVQLRPDDGNSAFGYDIFVNEEARSRGIGRAMMKQGTAILKSRGVSKLNICVFEDNAIAHKLYASLGFKETAYNAERNQFTLALDLNR